MDLARRRGLDERAAAELWQVAEVQGPDALTAFETAADRLPTVERAFALARGQARGS